jgi:hypothetical protein
MEMYLDWGNIALAIAALMGVVVWIFQFCCMAQSETSVPGQPGVHQAHINNNDSADDIEKRLVVIRSAAQYLLENRESDDEVKKIMCWFISEEAEQLTRRITVH